MLTVSTAPKPQLRSTWLRVGLSGCRVEDWRAHLVAPLAGSGEVDIECFKSTLKSAGFNTTDEVTSRAQP